MATTDLGRLTAHPLGQPQGRALEKLGFRIGDRGTHGSRSMMLAELEQILSATQASASYEDYRKAILEENAAGKSTASSRFWTWKKLRELYALDCRLPVFRCLRQLWDLDERSGWPVLAVLCACARDPLLRMSARVVQEAPIGSIVTPDDFRQALAEAAPDRFSAKTLRSIGSNVFATWTQSGHLVGTRVRRRTAPVVSPEVVAYALVLGRLTGARGPMLFSTFWAELLGRAESIVLDLAGAASRRGILALRRAGPVVEVGFAGLLTPAENEALA